MRVKRQRAQGVYRVNSGQWWALKEKCFADFDDAVKYVAAKKKMKAADLKRNTLKPQELVERVNCLNTIFKREPADLTNIIEIYPKCKRMIEACPVMEPLLYRAKTGVWRSAMLQAWEKHAPKIETSGIFSEYDACVLARTLLVDAVSFGATGQKRIKLASSLVLQNSRGGPGGQLGGGMSLARGPLRLSAPSPGPPGSGSRALGVTGA